MTRFSSLFTEDPHHNKVFVPSVSLSLSGAQTLNLKFDKTDRLSDVSYSGKKSPWFAALCDLLPGKTLTELLHFSRADMDEAFKEDESYWDHRQDEEDDLYSPEFELLRATLDHYRGRDYLYTESSPLICRCFAVREEDVRAFLKKESDPTIEKLALATKAGLGCRSCVPQMKRWLLIEKNDQRERVYKNKPIAEWLLDIDYMISCFPSAHEWEMQVESFRNRMVVITHKKDVSQRESEEMGIELQRFLAAGVDEGLSFFLRRA